MSRIELGDSIQLIKSVENESVHLILSDIPYGINYDEWDVEADEAIGGRR